MSVESNIAAVNASLRRYALYNRRELGEVVAGQARRLDFELWKRFRKRAPVKEALRSMLYAWISDGGKLRVGLNRSGGLRSYSEEIASRVKGTGFLATSWLFPTVRKSKPTSAVDTTQARNRAQTGEAVLNTAIGTRNPSVKLTSFLLGVERQDEQHNLVAAAIASRISEMEKYAADKQQKALNRIFKR